MKSNHFKISLFFASFFFRTYVQQSIPGYDLHRKDISMHRWWWTTFIKVKEHKINLENSKKSSILIWWDLIVLLKRIGELPKCALLYFLIKTVGSSVSVSFHVFMHVVVAFSPNPTCGGGIITKAACMYITITSWCNASCFVMWFILIYLCPY